MEVFEEKKGGQRMRGIFNKSLASKPLVSIITVSFNAAATIESTIQSVLQLTYPHIEFIVVDGGSTDGTIEIIRKYESKIDYWFSERDRGIYDGMNKGIESANGEWINFMNCVDTFASPGALDFIGEVGSATDIVYGNAVIRYPGFTTPFRMTPLDQMWKRMPFCHQASLTRTALMKHYKFDLDYMLSSDFDFIYKAWTDHKKFEQVDTIICIFDFTEGASIRHVFRSVRERKSIVLKRSFDLWKWIYHTVTIFYIHLAYYFKKLAGRRVTEVVTRLKAYRKS